MSKNFHSFVGADEIYEREDLCFITQGLAWFSSNTEQQIS
jgi:hypothetical protein